MPKETLHQYKIFFTYCDKNDKLTPREIMIVAHDTMEAKNMVKEFCNKKGGTCIAPFIEMIRKNKNNASILTEDYYNKELEALRKEKKHEIF